MGSQANTKLLKTTYLVIFLLFFAAPLIAISQENQETEEDEIPEAVKALQKTLNSKEVAELSKSIMNGLPPDQLSDAIDSLKNSGNKLAAKTLIELRNHRSPAVREKVAASLSSFNTPGTVEALKDLLDDQDAKVRSQAAFSIGSLGAKPAMNELMEAAVLGVKEAGEAVGKQATPGHVTRLTKMITDDNLLVLTPVLQALMDRKNIPNSHKLAIVARLGEISTISSKAQLRLLVKDLPESDPIKKAAQKALENEAKKKEEK